MWAVHGTLDIERRHSTNRSARGQCPTFQSDERDTPEPTSARSARPHYERDEGARGRGQPLAGVLRAFGERVDILPPLDRQHALLAGVAVLAGGDDVAADRGPAPAERHDVVHRECRVPDLAPAVVADPGR